MRILVIAMFLILGLSIYVTRETVALDPDNIKMVDYYQKYNIACNLSIDSYLDIFSNLTSKDYKIIAIKIYEPQEKIKKEIANIKVEEGSYLDYLNNYLKEYQKILAKYTLDDELARLNDKKIIITEITIVTNITTFEEINTKIKKGS